MGDRNRRVRHAGAEESGVLESPVVQRNSKSFRDVGRGVRPRLAVVARTPPPICVNRHRACLFIYSRNVAAGTLPEIVTESSVRETLNLRRTLTRSGCLSSAAN